MKNQLFSTSLLCCLLVSSCELNYKEINKEEAKEILEDILAKTDDAYEDIKSFNETLYTVNAINEKQELFSIETYDDSNQIYYRYRYSEIKEKTIEEYIYIKDNLYYEVDITNKEYTTSNNLSLFTTAEFVNRTKNMALTQKVILNNVLNNFDKDYEFLKAGKGNIIINNTNVGGYRIYTIKDYKLYKNQLCNSAMSSVFGNNIVITEYKAKLSYPDTEGFIKK